MKRLVSDCVRTAGKHQNSKPKDGTADAAEEGDINAPLWRIWKLLRPSWSAVFKGEAEVVGMLAICLARAYELRLSTVSH